MTQGAMIGIVLLMESGFKNTTISVGDSSNLTVCDCSIVGAREERGGAIKAETSGYVNITKTCILSCTATDSCGAAYLKCDHLSFNTSSISRCHGQKMTMEYEKIATGSNDRIQFELNTSYCTTYEQALGANFKCEFKYISFSTYYQNENSKSFIIHVTDVSLSFSYLNFIKNNVSNIVDLNEVLGNFSMCYFGYNVCKSISEKRNVTLINCTLFVNPGNSTVYSSQEAGHINMHTVFTNEQCSNNYNFSEAPTTMPAPTDVPQEHILRIHAI